MNAYIDTIKTTDAAGEQVLLYPRTKQSAVEGLEEALSDISADIEELKNGTGLGDTSNLVPNTRTIAGIDLVDDITFDELKEALQYLTETDIAELNTSGVAAYYKTDEKTVSTTALTDVVADTITLPAGTYIVQGKFLYLDGGIRYFHKLVYSGGSIQSSAYDSRGWTGGAITQIISLKKEETISYIVHIDKNVTLESVNIEAVRINDNSGTEMAGTIKPWLYDTENEVVIGVYNGKPVYRKYFTIHVKTTNGLYTQAITDLIPDYEEILNHKMYTTSGNLLNAIYANQGTLDTQDWMCYFVNVGGNIISISRSTSQPELDNDFSFMAEYTKTTDSEESGNNLNPYGIYDAKLDDFEARLEALENIDIAEGGAY